MQTQSHMEQSSSPFNNQSPIPMPSQSAPMCLCAECTAESFCCQSQQSPSSFDCNHRYQHQAGTDFQRGPCCEKHDKYIELVRNHITPHGQIIHLSASSQPSTTMTPSTNNGNNNNNNHNNNNTNNKENDNFEDKKIPSQRKRYHVRGVSSHYSMSSLGGHEDLILSDLSSCSPECDTRAASHHEKRLSTTFSQQQQQCISKTSSNTTNKEQSTMSNNDKNSCKGEIQTAKMSTSAHLKDMIDQVHMNCFASNVAMEDRSKFSKIFHCPTTTTVDEKNDRVNNSSVAYAFAMMDGHGGSSCSQYVHDHLLETIQRYISYVHDRRIHSIQKKSWLLDTLNYTKEQWRLLEEAQQSADQLESVRKLRLFFDDSKAIPMAIAHAFQSVDARFLNESAAKIIAHCNESANSSAWSNGVYGEHHNHPFVPKDCLAGSCALVTYFYQNKMYVANAGDCRCILARRTDANVLLSQDNKRNSARKIGSLEAIQCSRDHKASDPTELERLQRLFPHENDIVCSGRIKGKLQPTRAFGDIAFKHESSSQWMNTAGRAWNPPYITVEPEITEFSVDPSMGNEFVVLATDGLFDFLSNQQVIDIVQEYCIQHMTTAATGNRKEGNVCDVLVTNILQRAMTKYCHSTDEYLRLQTALHQSPERRRRFFDDVSVTVIFLNKYD